MERAERDLLRKHALELKQQPKSLKVIFIQIYKFEELQFKETFILAKRTTNS